MLDFVKKKLVFAIRKYFKKHHAFNFAMTIIPYYCFFSEREEKSPL